MQLSPDGKTGDIFIYGEITSFAWEDEGEHSATSFKNSLDDLGEVGTINLYVNSPGGSVFEGVAIHNMLKRHKAKVVAHVDALAASIASVIVMAADEIRMPSNSMLMIHNPWTITMGNSAELRKQADDLDRIGEAGKQSYLEKSNGKLTEEKLQEMLDDETWLSASEAYSYGLCDVIESANEAVACVDDELLAKFKNAPKSLTEQTETMSLEEKELREKIAEEARNSNKITNLILGGIFNE